jgi:hypothetical protein
MLSPSMFYQPLPACRSVYHCQDQRCLDPPVGVKKTKLIREQQWQNDLHGRRGFSGKLKNPGKPYFLSLVVAIVRDVNEEVDAYDMIYARKSIIRCGLSLDQDGVWKTEQFFPELQQIIVEHQNHFEGEPVP